MEHQRRTAAAGITAALLVAGLSACSSSSNQASDQQSSSGSCKANGVTNTSLAVGDIASLSGTYASFASPFADGVKARFDAINATGGVNGRKFDVSTADDASTPDGNLAAARSLVEGKKVAGIVSGSSFMAGGSTYLKQSGLPVIGGIATSDYEHTVNFFPITETSDGANNSTSTTLLWGEWAKAHGGTVTYSVGSGTPQGAQAADALTASSVKAGLKKGVLTLDLPVGTTNYTGEAEKAKSAGADTLLLPLAGPSSINVLKAMKQAGVQYKAALLLAGYDPGILKGNTDVLNGSTFVVWFAPFDSPVPGMAAYKAAMAKYTKSPLSQYSIEGWIAADLYIAGVKAAGSCPTGPNVVKAITNLQGYNANGLIGTTGYDLANRGGPATCGFFIDVKNGAFADENDGKQFCASDKTPIPIS